MEYSYSYQPDPISSIFSIAVAVLTIVGMWITFLKAGRHGWAAIIPFYNIYTLAKVGGKPGWWWVLWIIPIVGIVFHILIALGVAERFGKSAVFAIFGLWLFPFVGFPMLAWGSATYRGDAPAAGAGPAIAV